MPGECEIYETMLPWHGSVRNGFDPKGRGIYADGSFFFSIAEHKKEKLGKGKFCELNGSFRL